MCCDDAVRFVVCFCIAAAILSCVLAKGVHCFLLCVCEYVLGLDSCGNMYVRYYLYDVRTSSGLCIVRRVVALQWLVVSDFSIRFRSVASCG